MKEQWKAVVGFEGLYEVSDQGRVRSATKVLSPGILKTGYRVLQLYARGKSKTKLVSRLVLESFIGPAPTPKHHAAHTDGNNADNRLVNLRWATPKENNADKKLHGTENHALGEAVGRGVLTAISVERIRDLRAYGCTHRQISDWIGTCLSNVCYVLQRRTWAHV